MEKKEKESGFGIAILLLIVLLAAGSGEGISGPSPQPTTTPTTSPMPIGVEDEKVWEVIDEGIKNAQKNGIDCDPYLLLALQHVFTGGVFCDESWKEVPRPNECSPEQDVVGMFYFYIPTFERNAQRYGVQKNVWNPAISAEVVCYFVHDEANISLAQTKEKFISEFVEEGFIWNIFVSDAQNVYEKGRELMELNSKGGE